MCEGRALKNTKKQQHEGKPVANGVEMYQMDRENDESIERQRQRGKKGFREREREGERMR